MQARMGSTRLPGKVMLDLAGRPVLARVVERARAIPAATEVVVATSEQPQDTQIVEWCGRHGVPVLTGSESDVLDRFRSAARALDAEAVVRITADCPLLDPMVSHLVIGRFQRGDCDYASNTLPPTFPDGLDTEVLSRSALERAWREAHEPPDREHVTRYVRRNPERFRLANVSHDPDLSAQRWTLDTPRDLEFIRAVYARLGADRLFGMKEILGVARELEAARDG